MFLEIEKFKLVRPVPVFPFPHLTHLKSFLVRKIPLARWTHEPLLWGLLRCRCDLIPVNILLAFLGDSFERESSVVHIHRVNGVCVLFVTQKLRKHFAAIATSVPHRRTRCARVFR